MEEKHDIVAPVFKAKGKPVSKAKISSRPVVKMKGKHRITTRIEKERPAQHSLIVTQGACFSYMALLQILFMDNFKKELRS